MTETEFLNHTDALFAYLEDALDEAGLDLDCQHSGNVLTLEADNGEQIIINRHTPNQELWIAAKSGGFHFSRQGNEWRASRDGSEFFAVLNQVLSQSSGQTVQIPPFQAS